MNAKLLREKIIKKKFSIVSKIINRKYPPLLKILNSISNKTNKDSSKIYINNTDIRIILNISHNELMN